MNSRKILLFVWDSWPRHGINVKKQKETTLKAILFPKRIDPI